MGVVGVSDNSEKSCVKQRIAIDRENARCDMQTHGYAEVGLFEHKRVDGKIVSPRPCAARFFEAIGVEISGAFTAKPRASARGQSHHLW